jgi:hypothetical protein
VDKTAIGAIIAALLGGVVPFLIRALFHRDMAPEYLKPPILLASSPSRRDYRVESFEFGACVNCGELPIDDLTGRIAFSLPSFDLSP